MSTRLGIRRALLAAGALAAAAALLADDSPASAGSTATFTASTFAELNKGEPQGSLISSEGEVLPGYGVKSVGKVDAPMPQRMFWCTFEGLVAIAPLLGGGLGALQAMAVSTGFPFTIVLLLSCWAIFKGLMDEPR